MYIVAQIPSLSVLGCVVSGRFLKPSDTRFTQLTGNKMEEHVNDFLTGGWTYSTVSVVHLG